MASPLVIPAHIFPDMSESERLAEIDQMIDRQVKLYDAIEGSMSASDLLDFVESQGYEIDLWIEDIYEQSTV